MPIEKRSLTRPQMLTVILCGMVVAFAGLARMAFGNESADQFLGAALLMVGNWMAVPQLIAAAVAQQRDR